MKRGPPAWKPQHTHTQVAASPASSRAPVGGVVGPLWPRRRLLRLAHCFHGRAPDGALLKLLLPRCCLRVCGRGRGGGERQGSIRSERGDVIAGVSRGRCCARRASARASPPRTHPLCCPHACLHVLLCQRLRGAPVLLGEGETHTQRRARGCPPRTYPQLPPRCYNQAGAAPVQAWAVCVCVSAWAWGATHSPLATPAAAEAGTHSSECAAAQACVGVSFRCWVCCVGWVCSGESAAGCC
jgi:hypothetical protein